MYKATIVILLASMLITSCNDGGRQQSASTNKTDSVFVLPKEKEAGRLKLNTRVCYFSDVDSVYKQLDIALQTASEREKEVVDDIMKYAGLPSNFNIYRGDIDNALATMVDNKRLIIYNKDLFRIIDKLSNDYWSSVFILAHEIGHHLAYNISDTANSLKAELDADAFAASVLFKMGADSNQVAGAVHSKFISNTVDTKTHPSKTKRLSTIHQSWKSAASLRFNSAVPPPPHDQHELYRFSKEQLWNIPCADFEPFAPEYPEETPLVESKNIHGVILYVEHPEYETRQPKSLTRKIQVTLLITGSDNEAENKSHFLPQSKETIEVWYCEGSVMSVVEKFDLFFTPGRRIKFGTMMLCEHDACLLRISEAQTLR